MGSQIESVTKEVYARLAKHLDRGIPRLRNVIEGFPEANRKLKLPCISIDIQPTPYIPLQPYIWEQGGESDNKADIKYVVGEYEWPIQLDLWARTKEELHDLYEDFHVACNSQLPQVGLSLVLKEYHDIICSYTMTGMSFETNEVNAQRKEWRAIVTLEANCKAVIEKEEFIITEEPEVTLETPNEITE